MAERIGIGGWGERMLAGVMLLGIMAAILLGETGPLALPLGASPMRALLSHEAAVPAGPASAPAILDASLGGPDATVRIADSADLATAFERLGYHLDQAACCTHEVPRVLLQRLPADFPTLAANGPRKARFLEVLLPLVVEVNEEILAERARLLGIRAHVQAGEGVTLDERYWLRHLAGRYGGDADALDDLLARVDVVPPSLALAQAAVESGWGSSDYALADNSPFGQYMAAAGDGQAPDPARDGSGFHVRAFPGLLDAARAYAQNLDSHPAYRAFRALRAKERQAGIALDGDRLAGTLARYSARGRRYLRDVRRAMRANGLKHLDAARFAAPGPGLRVADRG